MKHIRRLLTIIIPLVLWTFQTKADTTDNYQIYLKNKIAITERDYNNILSSTIKSLDLSILNYSDTIKIKYSHCSPAITNRIITITDASNKVVFARSFPNYTVDNIMALPVKDIMDTPEVKSNSTFTLHYFDQQLPKAGIMISFVRIADKPLYTSNKTGLAYRVILAIILTVISFCTLLIWRRR